MKNTLIGACLFLLLSGSPPAWADIVVIVNQQSPVTALDMYQVKAIFMGKIGSFPDGRKVVAIDLPKSGLRSQFYHAVANKTTHMMASYWSRMLFTGAGMPPYQAESADDVLAKVAQDINAIGYVDAAKVTGKVKVVFKLSTKK